MTPTLPADAVKWLALHLGDRPWFRGAVIEGNGEDATIEVRTTCLQDAEAFIQDIGGRWNGYPMKARRVAT